MAEYPELHVYSAYSVDPQTSRAFKTFIKDDSGHLKLLLSIDMLNEGWMNGYRQAKAYFEEHGDLNVPVRYKTETGFALSNWLSSQREAKEGESRSKKLTEEQIRQLESIGMVWKRSRDERWNDFYSAACEYYNKNGNLEVPPQYKTPDGFCLGMWIDDQKRNFKKGKLLNQKRYARLVKIGMFETPAVSGN